VRFQQLYLERKLRFLACLLFLCCSVLFVCLRRGLTRRLLGLRSNHTGNRANPNRNEEDRSSEKSHVGSLGAAATAVKPPLPVRFGAVTSQFAQLPRIPDSRTCV
jgi:hypothetical protein